MNTGSLAVLRRLSVVVLSILASCCAASSILSCVLISDTILFLDVCFALFRLLSMTCLLMARVLACLSLAVRCAYGPAFILGDRRGFVAVRAGTGLALALPIVNNLGLPRAVPWLCLIAAHVNVRLPQAFTMLGRFRHRVFRYDCVASCFALVNPWFGLERPRACGAA